MRTILRAYEKGEFVLICYVPIMIVLTVFITQIPQFFPVLTYNHVFLIETALHLTLAGGLALIFLDIKNVPEKRLKTTDWYMCVIVALFLIGAVVGVLIALMNIALMTFNDSPAFDGIRQHYGYNGALKQILRMVVMFIGAWVWLKGIRSHHAVLAISGMVICMLLASPDSYVRSKFSQMKQREMKSITITNEEIPSEAETNGQEEMDKEPRSEMRRHFAFGTDKVQGFWMPFWSSRFYGIALMLFTLVRYQKPDKQLE